MLRIPGDVPFPPRRVRKDGGDGAPAMNPKATPASTAETAPFPRTDPGGVLLIHGSALGDGILSLPAVFSIRRAFPRAVITLIGHPERWTWVRPSPFDRILPLEGISLHRLFLPEGPFPPVLESLLGEQDLVISWYGDDVFGKNLKSLVRGMLLFNPFRPASLTEHASRFFLETLRPLGIPLLAAAPSLEAPLPPDVPGEGGPIAVLHPGSGSRKKCWPPENFLRLAGAVERRLGLSCRCLMGEADRWMAGHPVFRATPAAGDVLRDLPLRRVASILKQGKVYVGNDSGISHMAAALGVPSVVLFLTTDPGIWRPPGDHVRVLYRPSEGIGVADVFREITDILS
jgi:hypothetical protein